MECFEAQNLSMQYVNGELSEGKMEEFLEHIDMCNDCKEELEICFTIVNGMKELEGEKSRINNFHLAFESMLDNSKRKIEKSTKGFKKKLIILDIILFIPMFFVMSDSKMHSLSDNAIYTDVKKSDFYIDLFMNKRKNGINNYIDNNKIYIESYIMNNIKDNLEGSNNDIQNSLDNDTSTIQVQ